MSTISSTQELPVEQQLLQEQPPPPASQVPTQPRSWTGSIEEYLAENGVVYDKATPLQSGTSCYLWRIDGLEDASGQPAVLKVADSTPKFDDRPLSADRLRAEVQALAESKAVAQACTQEPSVQVPRVVQTTTNGLIMTWAGDKDLRTAYKEAAAGGDDAALDFAAIGARLGYWLASLHLAGIQAGPDGWPDEAPELHQFYAPGGVEESMVGAVFGADDDAVQRALGVLRTPDRVRTLTPWDFRPMNTLLHDGGNRLSIVDWELCHYGEPSRDLRMWVAEAVVMEAQYGDRGMLAAFLSAYGRGVAGAALVVVDDMFVRKVAASVGVLTMFLMSVGPQVWDCAAEEDTHYWKGRAVEFLRAGANGDMDWLKQSCLRPLLRL